jgi:A/G-specific adenine glycosylase
MRVPDTTKEFRRLILCWGRSNQRSFPWRETSDAYQVLVAEVMLQRTSATSVARVYPGFVKRWPTPQALAAAPEQEIRRSLESLGLSFRALRLRDIALALSNEEEVSLDPLWLIALPGIGAYVAHAVPVFAAQQDLPVVDGVVGRVLRRYFGLHGRRQASRDRELWDVARQLAFGGRARELWWGVLDFAEAICRPRPKCHICPLRRTCAFRLSAE